jgi:hypothetical protein
VVHGLPVRLDVNYVGASFQALYVVEKHRG